MKIMQLFYYAHVKVNANWNDANIICFIEYIRRIHDG